ncbi:penicillin-binding protein 2 [Acidimicrobium ferrooxidans DSM 10331]|uniref:Penicillin-binding protein 2 n=1 Tax=Acidimicrobium ferrooxidans (strain DSM 10331 / JCM 15462 / NBRC 103882 / ICP) TaxID=525909 RepID=C7LYA9_ACIFD|nr:penicillin-binding protein 2 [Acidimicrobium ferrooxidans DSM 10331]
MLGLATLALFGGLLARLYSLQVLEAPTYQQAAVENSVRTVSVPAPRGLILDRNGTVLVGNQVVDVVGLSAYEAYLHPAVVGRLAKVLGLSAAQVKADLANSQYSTYEPTPIATGVSQATAVSIEEHAAEFPGVVVELETQRTYPQGDTAAHILGYVGPISPSQLAKLAKYGYAAGDQVGRAGVEETFNQYLHGRAGSEQLLVNAFGQVVGVRKRVAPTPGGNLVLSISLPLERYVEQVLATQVRKLSNSYNSYFGRYTGNLGGAAVVEDPNNGQILAMASYPTYNPEWWVGGISTQHYAELTSASANDPLLNRAISAAFTPGSTFKLATASAALQDGLITPSTVIDDTGQFQIPNCTGSFCSLHNSGGEALGPITITTALAASDDVFFYTLGYRFYTQAAQFGQTPIQNMAAAYGWGKPTGIALPGEVSGMVDSPQLRKYLHEHYPQAYPYDTWYVADQLEMAFGQGLTEITPIQLANAYSTFLNGGTRYVPQIALAVTNDQGRVIQRFAPKVAGHVTLSPTVRQTLIQGYEEEVSNPLGTGYYVWQGWPDASYTIAGKTGTASVSGQVPNSWYVGMGPMQNPQYVVVVAIPNGGFGDLGAGPVAREIFTYLRAHPVGAPNYQVSHLAAGSITPVGQLGRTSAG